MPGTRTLFRRTRIAVISAVGAMLAAACAPASTTPDLPVEPAGDFVVNVVDSLNDAGRGTSVVLDEEGNPAISYLLVKPVLREGELPAAVTPGEPQPPAVLVATRAENAWTRTSVTPQNTAPAEGEAPEIANRNKEAKPGVSTALAIDGDGTYHVIWSTPSGLYYSSGGRDGFQEAQRIVELGVTGASIAVTSGGTPWVAFYQGDIAYGAPASVQVMPTTIQAATLEGEAWAVEEIAPVTGCADCPLTRTAIAIGPDDQPIVAYTDPSAGTPTLARRGGPDLTGASGSWSTEAIETGGGGFGVAMATDGDGNPHVVYYSQVGEVQEAHSTGPGSWQVTPVATTAVAEPTPEQTVGWGAGIALDGEGTHHVVYADPSTGQIMLATGGEGELEAVQVPGGAAGATPAIAVAAEGEQLAIAWFDLEDRNLDVATRASGELPLAFSPQPPATPTGGGATTEPPAAQCEPEGTELQIAAQGVQFDTDCLAAPAGEPFAIAFDNQDAGIPHNVAIYEANPLQDPNASEVFIGEIITGPNQATYEVEAIEAGELFFQCDVHPTMLGTFVAA